MRNPNGSSHGFVLITSRINLIDHWITTFNFAKKEALGSKKKTC